MAAGAMTRQETKAEAFQALHAGEAFVIPNPVGRRLGPCPRGARVQGARDARAPASPSRSGGWTASVTLDEVVEHAAALDRATDLPLSVDLENGYGADPESAALAITRVAEAGAVGGSIEDYDPAGAPLRARRTPSSGSPPRSRRRAALGFPFMLTARAENHIRGNPDLDDTIARLQAFEEAGADVLYAPGSANGGGDPSRVRGRLQAGQRARAARAVARARSSRPARSG